jgi:hypothetical protein
MLDTNTAFTSSNDVLSVLVPAGEAPRARLVLARISSGPSFP